MTLMYFIASKVGKGMILLMSHKSIRIYIRHVVINIILLYLIAIKNYLVVKQYLNVLKLIVKLNQQYL